MADNDSNDRPRGGGGKWVRDIATAERDAECARLRSQGKTYRAIAAELNIDVKSAHEGVARCFKETVAEAGETLRQVELERLDTAQAATMAVLETKHVVVSHGKVIYSGTEPLIDDGPILAAVDRLVKISESRRKLLGLDAAQKLDVSGGITYEIVGVDPELIG